MSQLPARTIAAPVQHPESRAYFEATARGVLLLRRCRACGKAHFYPRTLCPFCMGATDWEQAAGTGVIYSFSLMRHAEVPYVMAYVTLDEGPTMMTNIVDCDSDAIHIGQRVGVVFKPTEGGPPVPMFTPL